METENVLLRFGAAVRKLRQGMGISQEELAGRAGLHRTYVSDIERGERNVSLESIAKLAVALQTSLSNLFGHFRGLQNPPVHGQRPEGLNEFMDILLVEDDPRDVEMTLAGFQLARITNRVRVARDGQEALDILLGNGSHARRRMNLRPGLILLDLNLPKVSGLEVLRRIKRDARTRTIPVIILTASQKARDRAECQRWAAETYLIKPVGFQNFSRATPKLSLQWALL